MAMVTCPACGSLAPHPEPICGSCESPLGTIHEEPGMRVAEDGTRHISTPASSLLAGEIDDNQREALLTRPTQSDESIQMTAPRADGAREVESGTQAAVRDIPVAADVPPTAQRAGASEPRWLRPAFAGMLVLAAVAALFVTIGPGSQYRRAIAQEPAPTATATLAPTATPTLTTPASPAPMPGFTWYTDQNAHFSLQYPTTWKQQPVDSTLGVEFADGNTADAGTYVLDVYHPDPKTSNVPAQQDDNSTAASWVDFVLGNLQQQELAHGSTFQRLPGPIPAVTFGKQTWQSGIATINEMINGQALPVRVQVYATIHNGQPYIINVYALTDAFATGQQQYFTPMLNSFQFLSPAP